MPNGEIEYVRTPMPKEALLHPQDEDYPVESNAHDKDRTYLSYAIEPRLPRGWIVLSSCRVDWGVPGIEPHGPDISVFKGLRGPERDWKTFYVVREKAKPVAVVEITSSSTRQNDLKVKVDEYFRAGVPLYAIVDARTRKGKRHIQIIGYQAGPKSYEKMELDTNGRLLLAPLGILLGAENGRVWCYDAKTGERIDDHKTTARARSAAEERARIAEAEVSAARQAKQEADEVIRRLQEEVRRLRGDA
jgi:Uma2 family endonuclease